MERSNSFGMSWADQWDYGGDAPSAASQKKGGGGKKNGVEKTKEIASNGFKKVKEGTTQGFQWVKEKYQKRTQKH
ncbi:hypothetical protein ACMD2_15432 [Ananas comosus]|uniref:Uncharacterized protein n=1 Tax=Ananas comosus TaxID=4615 RepID=A0A199W4M7_ANACO|nr:hypothetical protein ACMD2_15432 [Ananas comosus]